MLINLLVRNVKKFLICCPHENMEKTPSKVETI